MQGGREGEGGRGSKKVNEMENVTVMWSSTVAVAVAVAGCQTDWPENRDALAAVSDGFDRVLSLVARRRRRHNRVSTLHVYDVRLHILSQNGEGDAAVQR